MIRWIGKQTVNITALVSAVIALGLGFEWWHWSPTQIGLVMGVLAAVLAFFVNQTVTPNLEIGDQTKLFQGPAPVDGPGE